MLRPQPNDALAAMWASSEARGVNPFALDVKPVAVEEVPGRRPPARFEPIAPPPSLRWDRSQLAPAPRR